jgi:1-acyl-sn-glycerol-3-phosphate acyltransferase
MIPIPRSNRVEAIRNLQLARERFAKGHQFALAPEGQRMPTEKLGPFKSGPFILAIEGQVPVVPIIIQNAGAIQPKGQWFPNWGVWQSEVQLHIEPAISTLGMTVDADKDTLKEKVRKAMNRYIPNAELH